MKKLFTLLLLIFFMSNIQAQIPDFQEGKYVYDEINFFSLNELEALESQLSYLNRELDVRLDIILIDSLQSYLPFDESDNHLALKPARNMLYDHWFMKWDVDLREKRVFYFFLEEHGMFDIIKTVPAYEALTNAQRDEIVYFNNKNYFDEGRIEQGVKNSIHDVLNHFLIPLNMQQEQRRLAEIVRIEDSIAAAKEVQKQILEEKKEKQRSANRMKLVNSIFGFLFKIAIALAFLILCVQLWMRARFRSKKSNLESKIFSNHSFLKQELEEINLELLPVWESKKLLDLKQKIDFNITRIIKYEFTVTNLGFKERAKLSPIEKHRKDLFVEAKDWLKLLRSELRSLTTKYSQDEDELYKSFLTELDDALSLIQSLSKESIVMAEPLNTIGHIKKTVKDFKNKEGREQHTLSRLIFSSQSEINELVECVNTFNNNYQLIKKVLGYDFIAKEVFKSFDPEKGMKRKFTHLRKDIEVLQEIDNSIKEFVKVNFKEAIKRSEKGEEVASGIKDLLIELDLV